MTQKMFFIIFRNFISLKSSLLFRLAVAILCRVVSPFKKENNCLSLNDLE